MTDDPTEMDDRSALAAEYAIGLLDGPTMAEARALVVSDSAFAAEVGSWSARLAPLFDDVDEVAPPAGSWTAIDRRIGTAAPTVAANDNLVAIHRRLAMWRGATAGMAVLAAALALAVFTPSVVPTAAPPSPVQSPAPAPSRPMVALLGNPHEAPKLMASWDPGARQLVLAAAAPMPVSVNHAHELWVIPAGGKPRSLGVMPAGTRMHLAIPAALSGELAEGASLAISVEPARGSPTGQPTGPVIASGALERA